MARYNNEDQINLEEILEEGFLDRFKARGAQALGAVKGAGQQIKGGAQQMAGNVVQKAGNLAAKGVQAVGGQIDPSQNKLTQAGQGLQAQGQGNVAAGAVQGQIAKIDSYKKSAGKNIQKLVADIQNDLAKLGIQVNTNKMAGFAKGMTTNLMNALDLLKDQATPQQAQAAPQQQGGLDPNSPLALRSAMPEAEEDYY